MSVEVAFALGLALAAVHALHCALMCGVFALRARASFRSVQAAARSARYLAGKAFTYAFLGALAGAFSASATQRVAGAGFALALVAAGACLLAAWRTARGASASSRVERALAACFAPALRTLAPLARGPFLLGLLNGFLPCGLTALALAQAAASGSAMAGAACLLGLGLGTAPALLVASALGDRALRWARSPIARGVAAIALALFAGLTSARAIAAWQDSRSTGSAPRSAALPIEVCGFELGGARAK